MSAPDRGRIIRFKDFPELHRTLWQKGMTERDRHGSRPYGATLSPKTEYYARHGWGRLMATCPDDERSLPPDELGTPRVIRRFVAAMKQAGNQGNTIATRLWEVRTALRIMCPQKDFRWITSPDGNDVRSLFPFERRLFKIYHPRRLYHWGFQLMDQALKIVNPRSRAIQYRNGLIIAILAARAPRVRSLASIQLRVQIVRHDNRFRFVFRKADLKWRNALEYDLPESLTKRIEHYLRDERPMLLAGKDHDWFWVRRGGDRLQEIGIAQMIRRQSEKDLEGAFGPQRFRHGAGTIAPMADPTRPGAVAAMLGHSQAVSEETYNIGRQQEAAEKLHRNLAKERQRLEGVALRAFGRGGQRRLNGARPRLEG
jgi:hypothetical protein